MVGVILFIMSV